MPVYNLKQALRIIMKDKFHSFLNITGLALGLCCSILVLLFVQNELSYDKHHKKADRIFRYGVNMTIGGINSTQATCNMALAPLLQKEIPEIVEFVRCNYTGNMLVEANEKSLYEDKLMIIDSSVFKVFTFPFVHGNSFNALEKPNTIVLTEDLAHKYFEDQNPVGEEIEIDNEIYEVTGVIHNLPDNSHLKFSGLISINSYLHGKNLEEIYSPSALGGNMRFLTYFLFAKNFTAEQFYRKFQDFYQREMVNYDKINYKAVVEPISDIYLNSKIRENFSKSNRRFLFGFVSIGLFILILACINYINLATSRAGNRSKEIGVKKVLGAERKQLINQFLSESVVLAFLALILGFLLVELILKITPFNDLINKNLQIDFFDNPLLLGGSALITLFVGFISGLYPAFYLSHVTPISSMRGNIKKGKAGQFFRNALVSFQFIISITAVIITFHMRQQIEYMQNLDLGFKKENVLMIYSTNQEVKEKFSSFRDAILEHHNIVSAGFSHSTLGRGVSGLAFEWETETGEMVTYANRAFYADKSFLKTMGIPIIAGTNFINERTLESSIDFIVNEALVKFFGWKDPIGKKTQYGQVIGVVKDFSYASARNEILPMFIIQSSQPLGVLNVRLKGDNIAQTMDFIKQKWMEFAPDYPINYSFLEQDLNVIYSTDETQKKLSSIFTYFCILISCFGLFGLTSYTTIQRTKEVAIRKILGARVTGIISTLFKGIFTIIIISTILAVPFAFYLFNLWQNNFANKTKVNPVLIVYVFLGALLVSFLTSVYHTIKVANTNPVEALKYE